MARALALIKITRSNAWGHLTHRAARSRLSRSHPGGTCSGRRLLGGSSYQPVEGSGGLQGWPERGAETSQAHSGRPRRVLGSRPPGGTGWLASGRCEEPITRWENPGLQADLGPLGFRQDLQRVPPGDSPAASSAPSFRCTGRVAAALGTVLLRAACPQRELGWRTYLRMDPSPAASLRPQSSRQDKLHHLHGTCWTARSSLASSLGASLSLSCAPCPVPRPRMTCIGAASKLPPEDVERRPLGWV